jgi:hypothetical protein
MRLYCKVECETASNAFVCFKLLSPYGTGYRHGSSSHGNSSGRQALNSSHVLTVTRTGPLNDYSMHLRITQLSVLFGMWNQGSHSRLSRVGVCRVEYQLRRVLTAAADPTTKHMATTQQLLIMCQREAYSPHWNNIQAV